MDLNKQKDWDNHISSTFRNYFLMCMIILLESTEKLTEFIKYQKYWTL